MVIHLSNGSEMGIVLGTYWNQGNPAGNPCSYRKEIGEKAYFMYQDGLLTLGQNIVYIIIFFVSVAYLVDATYNPFLYFRF